MLKHLALLLGLAAPVAAADRPHILWLSAEDISPHLGCYGDENAITPNLDRLASEGIRYSHAYTTAGVCAPCRSGIITGMYQTSLGTHHMRCNATLPETVRPFPLFLREAGYFGSNQSKTDYQFSKPSSKEIWDSIGGKAHWRDRKDPDQPFFSVFNFTGCHESGIASESKYETVTENLTSDQRRDPQKLELPPYYPDTPVTREDWKRNHELITAMDAWAGDLIQQLKDDGLYEDTIIFFWSDHGVGLPRAKRWLYDSGTHIPLIVRIPEKYRLKGQGKPGSVNDELVSSIDLAPTVLNLAGVDLAPQFQGRAFLGGNLTPKRDYVHGARDRMDERYDIIRSVFDGRYRYIRNYTPLKPYYQYMNTPEKGATMRELRRLDAEGGLPPAAKLFMAKRKPVEELYDLQGDPYEIDNLADQPAMKEKLEELRTEHLKWVQESRDLGLLPESEITVRTRIHGSDHAILHQDGSEELYSRLAVAAKSASDGVDAIPAMMQAMADDDTAVRYWGATGLGNVLREGAEIPAKAQRQLRAALEDSGACTRIAAARALLYLSDRDRRKGLATLSREMEGELEWARLQASIVLDEADELARPALKALQGGLKDQPNKYIIRVSNKAVNDLLGTSNTVP